MRMGVGLRMPRRVVRAWTRGERVVCARHALEVYDPRASHLQHRLADHIPSLFDSTTLRQLASVNMGPADYIATPTTPYPSRERPPLGTEPS